ncbi:DUF6397 family protein [Streptomyces sp. LHD-70]|uniref:DUF6397 family protein n=1 Tax=Streptomyces sp. LHD-70 TaxID=3072140 RepID=UPI00280EC31F|nr:DUF6397 family protein [Streptomyces sp. LHD-70]MDQ8703770.1 DUF6397 family protein [Streptomyces sp. LHD-70]
MTGKAVPTKPVQALTASYAPSRAAIDLGLKRTELLLAVQLGLVRTTAGQDPGRWRIPRAEIERLQSAQGFPDTLRERVKLVGTTEGAELMGITRDRFTKLARLGFLTPAKFYLNRYRTLVWLYLADDIRQFAEANASLLSGKAPITLRTRLGAGEDRRARNWRERHCGHLLRLARDPWQSAAVTASMLDPTQVADIVPDPYERAYLNRLRPESTTLPGAPDSPTAQAAARVLQADDPDEIRWLRTTLTLGIDEARNERPAPRPREAPPKTPSSAPDAPAQASPLNTATAPQSNIPRGVEPTTSTRTPAPTRPFEDALEHCDGPDDPGGGVERALCEARGEHRDQRDREAAPATGPARRGLLGWLSRRQG